MTQNTNHRQTEMPTDPIKASKRIQLGIFVGTALTANGLDVWMTWYALQNPNFGELNSIVPSVMDDAGVLPALLLLKAALFWLTLWWSFIMYRIQKPHLAWASWYGNAVLGLVVVGKNLSVLGWLP